MEINNTPNLNKPKRTAFKSETKGAPVDKMSEFLNKFNDEAQKLTDVGFFREISADFMNDNPLRYVRRIGLRIIPESTASNSKGRSLEAYVTNKSDRYEEPKTLQFGTRDEILKYLKSPQLKEDLEEFVTKTSDKFYGDNYL